MCHIGDYSYLPVVIKKKHQRNNTAVLKKVTANSCTYMLIMSIIMSVIMSLIMSVIMSVIMSIIMSVIVAIVAHHRGGIRQGSGVRQGSGIR